jgi:hypothetical protein
VSDDPDRDELLNDVQEAEAEVRRSWKAFADAQPAYVETFLKDQAKTTAVEQETVALAFPGGVKALRDALYAITDQISDATKRYFDGVPDRDVLSGWTDQREDGKLEAIMRPFGEFLLSHDFDGGGGGLNRHPAYSAGWYFYRDSQWHSTKQRGGRGMLLNKRYGAYEEALRNLGSARGALDEYDVASRKSTVKGLWED